MQQTETKARRAKLASLIAGAALLGSLTATSASATSAAAATTFHVYAPIVGFHTGAGVGTVAPVKLGALIAQPLAGPSPNVRAAVSRNGGAFTTLSLSEYTTGATAVTGITGLGPLLPKVEGSWWETGRTLAETGTYRFRILARNPATGVWTSWVYGPTIRARAIQETSTIWHYSAGWMRLSSTSYLGGGRMVSSTAGATATATFSASSIAWVANRSPQGGSAEVWLDGKLATTVSLYETIWPKGTGPQIVFSQTWLTPGTHTIKIKVLGTAGHPAVNIEELLDIR